MHTPVMLAESLDLLAIRPDGIYVDATCGLGGHTGAIARRLTTGMVLACDRDAESLELARANTADCADRIRFHHAAFSAIANLLENAGVGPVDGLLADLGVSLFQLTSAHRGLSLMAEGPLDFRMDRSQPETGADIVNHWAERDLADLLFRLAQEGGSRRIARAIVRARPIQTTTHLARVVSGAAPRTSRLHPATKTFLAVRLATNRELEELDTLLEAVPRLLKPGARGVVISFMSSEDTRVKHAFQDLARSGRARLVNKHVIKPGREECVRNPPSRSAKLRAIEMM